MLALLTKIEGSMITVIIATTGRPNSISDTLQSLAKANSPACPWQLLVIVNGGDSASLEVAKTFTSKLPIRTFFLKEYGKNKSINSVVDQVDSGLVLFTDDDIRFDENWLVSWSRYAQNLEQDVLFCGPIELDMNDETRGKIEFLNLSQEFLFSKTPNLKRGPVSAEYCWGGNLAIPFDIFKQGIRFDEKIGPNGSSNYLMGSEVELCIRLEKMGYKCHYVSEPKVFHRVRNDQLADASISNRYFRAGRSAYLCRRRDQKARLLPWDVLKGLFFLKLNLFLKRSHSSEQSLRQKKNTYAFLKGQIYEYFFSVLPLR